MNVLLLSLVFGPMLMAFVCWLAGRRSKPLRDLLACLTGGAAFVLAAVTAAMPGAEAHVGQVCALGLSLELDGFRKVYVLVIALMWMMTLLLSRDYFAHYHNRNRYYFFNLMTLGATLGVFLAADLFTAFIFFEVMSFTSYTWVIQEETPGAVRAANTYLAVAVIGGLVALMGIFLVQHYLGTTDISRLYDLARACKNKAALYAAGGCILFGFGAKAGMFPLHIWLPKAHPVAPAPASALLSGVLTKSGVWGILAISCNIFRHDPVWGGVILALGTVTMVLGAVLALFSIDLKRTLACSSMSQIGFILVGVGMMGLLGEENALAARGTLLHMVNHSLFKLVLFMCAGVVFMNLHKLDLNDIRGFGRKKPILNFAFLMGAMGIGGVPLLNGYVSKTLLHESIVEFSDKPLMLLVGWRAALSGPVMTLVEWLFLISGGMTVAYMTKLYVALFVEKHPEKQAEFDGKRRYMGPLSVFALLGSALVLPILGLSANWSMNAIADVGTDFLHAGHLRHAVEYLSWVNLKGALISIAIGGALYFLVVRRLLMKDGRYVDRWPAGLDLEDLVYRPLILTWLPGLFGWLAALFGENKVTAPLCRGVLRLAGILSRFFADCLDGLVFLLMHTVFKESGEREENRMTRTAAYKLGAKVDAAAERMGRKRNGERSYASLFFRAVRTFSDTTYRIMGNLSFALLMMCLGICIVFIYMLVLH